MGLRCHTFVALKLKGEKVWLVQTRIDGLENISASRHHTREGNSGKKEALTAHISTLMFHHDLTRGVLGVFFLSSERESPCSPGKQTFMGEICAAAVNPEITRVRATKASNGSSDLQIIYHGWVDAGKRLWICNTPNGRLSYDLVSAGYCWRTARSNYPVMAWLAGKPEFLGLRHRIRPLSYNSFG